MSYCSENRLPLSTPVRRIVEIIELLDYIKVQDGLRIENEISSYMWLGSEESISFVGVELSVYREADYISVQTRTRVGRSYWDLEHQNKTISLLKSLFHGSFITDEGPNRYLRIDIPMPSRISCALFKARWINHNAMTKPLTYFDCRNLTGDIARENLTGLTWLDEYNPRILSNNMVIPYIVGCWESYCRNAFIAVLKYTKGVPDRAIKNCRISNNDLLKIIYKEGDLAAILADSLSFQRPSVISENFRGLNNRIDIASWLRKPYHNRKVTLYDSIEGLIDVRDRLVHTGSTSLEYSDKRIKQIINDLNEAADRIYQGLGQVYEFEPSFAF